MSSERRKRGGRESCAAVAAALHLAAFPLPPAVSNLASAPTPDRSARADLVEVVRRIGAGDEAALGDLYDATRTAVYGLARHVLGEDEAAEEATLDVYQQVWRDARGFDVRRGSVLGWLTNLASSRSIDRLRARGGALRRLEQPLESVHDSADPTPGPDEASWLRERRALVRAALGRLDVEERRTLLYAFFLGLSHRQIAEKLGHPLGTVKSRIRSGMIRLREGLRQLETGA